jgi:quinol monooxygenase YgiN
MMYVVVVRGKLKGSEAEAQQVHDATISMISAQNRELGSTGHQAYLNTQDPKEFLALDFWDNIEAIQKLYSDPALAEEFGKLFDGEPDVTIWAESGWAGY